MIRLHKFTTTTTVDLTDEQRSEIGPLKNPGNLPVDGTVESITIIDHWNADGKWMLRQTISATAYANLRLPNGDLEATAVTAFGYDTRVALYELILVIDRPLKAKVKFS